MIYRAFWNFKGIKCFPLPGGVLNTPPAVPGHPFFVGAASRRGETGAGFRSTSSRPLSLTRRAARGGINCGPAAPDSPRLNHAQAQKTRLTAQAGPVGFIYSGSGGIRSAERKGGSVPKAGREQTGSKLEALA